MIELPPDPYEALGVKQDAPLSDIRTAFRKLVLKAHPDKVQDPDLKQQKTEEFHAIHQAWELLSDDSKRQKYHRDRARVELKNAEAELRANMATSSPANPRSRRSTSYYDEPHTSYSSSPAAHKVYTRTPPHSWDEMSGGARYEYTTKPSATAEREARAARREQERQEEKWRQEADLAKKARREERKKEKEKESKDREKRKDKEAREKEKKKAAKEQKRQQERQQEEALRQQRAAEQQEDTSSSSESEDEPIPRKQERKKSTSSRKADPSPQPPLSSERERKHSINLDQAREYLTRSGAHVPVLNRAATMDSAGVPYAPTPPPAGHPFYPPPPGPAEEEESPKRSSKSSRRGPSTRDKAMHKKSSARDSSREPKPIIVDAAPRKSNTESPFTKPIPGLQRAQTDQPQYNRGGWNTDSDRERSRSRGDGAPVFDTSEDEEEADQSTRRNRRRRQSPEEMPEHTTRYTVKKGATSTMPMPTPIPTAYGPDGASPRSHRNSKGSYNVSNTSAVRMPVGSYGSYEDAYSYTGHKVKYAQTFDPTEVQFANLPHRTSQHA